MIPYLIAYILSMICIHFSFEYKSNKRKRIVFSLLAILIPTLLATFRGNSVGTDTYMYGFEFFEPAIQVDSFDEYKQILSTLRYGSIEFVYVLINYIIAKLTRSHYVLFFVYSFVTHLCVALGINKILKEKKLVLLAFSVYYFALYCFSLNLMRQQLAGALLFYGICELLSGSYIKYFVFLVLSFLIHNSAILGFVVLPLYECIKFVRNKEYANKFYVFIILSGICVLFCFPLIVKLLITIGLLGSRYEVYTGNGIPIAINTLIKRLPIILLMVVYGKRFIEKKEINLVLSFLIYIEILLSQLSIVVDFAYRITIYFTFLWIVALPQFITITNKKDKALIHGLLYAYLIGYWLLNFVILKGEAVVPYTIFN